MNEVGKLLSELEAAARTFASPDTGPIGATASEDRDLLAEAMAEVARHHGLPTATIALTAGLPLTNGRLALDHIDTAAARAGLLCELVARPLTKLSDTDLPALLLFNDGGLAVIWRLERGTWGRPKRFEISRPGRPASRTLQPIAELAATASGKVVLLRPASGLDERGATAMSERRRGWFLPAFSASRRIYAEAILATLAINVLALALPLFTMNVYDRVLPNAIEETLWALAIGVMLATLFDTTIKVLRARFIDIAGRRADVVLSSYIYGRLLGARLPDRPVSAGVRANALREFETIREFFTSATLTAFGDAPFLVVFLAAVFVLSGPLGLVLLGAIPVVVLAAWLTQRALARLTESAFRESAQKTAVLVETVVGLETLKAANAESWAAAKWETAVADHIRTSQAIRETSNFGQTIVQALQTLTQILMIVVGFYLVAAGELTMGGLIAATMLAGRALQPLGQIAMLVTRVHQVRLAFRAIDDIVHAEQERPEGRRLLTPVRIAGHVAFERVTFSYEKDAPLSLNEISFQVRPGEKVALIGAIGSGKTTALKLIQALARPTTGRVLIDGMPATQIDPAVLRAHVGFALQGADLFHGTIRSNIALADPGASDEAVLNAARAAGALDWIMRTPKGLDTPVRERGVGLSGGQRQSVALARALMGNPSVVLLDEPTSDMDGRTEQIVVDALRHSCRDRTLIAISHRPAVLALVDRLIVLEGGRKTHDGPKAAVLKELEAVTRARISDAALKTAKVGP
ncbi:MAG: type I secretion system permease/ATPase [Hyphomicrobiaceae bacterium]|nr:type I secretion system permease/ATPase [Hyphomicrobiaceae bacterium]